MKLTQLKRMCNFKCGWSMTKHTTQRGILTLKNKLEEQTSSKIPTNDLAKLAEFVLKNSETKGCRFESGC